MAKILQLDNELTSDRKPIKVGDKSTGLLVSNSNVFVENQPTEDNHIATKKYVDLVHAGMIIGYTRIANNGTGYVDNQISPNGTLSVLQTVSGTDVSVTFDAPLSGNVEIQMLASVYASSKTLEFALSSDASFTEVDEKHTYDAGAQSSDETDQNMTLVSFVVTGLTAGQSYTYYIGAAETSSGTSNIRHGRFRSTGTHYPPIIIKAIALPSTITTGE